ncbi:Pol polyprotein [Gossypium australe]|uniref:Pol polyprotein n=1 Tax=Gossypium australe TaxID=47621 RepID=A0A5B6WMH6_9ROSI|nr:Pol polyprotein [Gossypium australe]
MIKRLVTENEVTEILCHCHLAPSGGHFGESRVAAKALKLRFFWPTLFKGAYVYVKSCDQCQRSGNITNRNKIPRTNIVELITYLNGLKLRHIRKMMPRVPFCEQIVEMVAQKHRVWHKISTTYHPQTNGQVELAKKEIKCILENVV